jgi:hypothetical protein
MTYRLYSRQVTILSARLDFFGVIFINIIINIFNTPPVRFKKT